VRHLRVLLASTGHATLTGAGRSANVLEIVHMEVYQNQNGPMLKCQDWKVHHEGTF